MERVVRQISRFKRVFHKPNTEWTDHLTALREIANSIEALNDCDDVVQHHLVSLADEFSTLLKSIRSKLVAETCIELLRIIRSIHHHSSALINVLLPAFASTAKGSTVAIRDPGHNLFCQISQFARYDLHILHQIYRQSPQERVRVLVLQQLVVILNHWSKQDISPYYQDVLEMTRRGHRDASPHVRRVSRDTLCALGDIWQENMDELVDIPTVPGRDALLREKPEAGLTKAIRAKYDKSRDKIVDSIRQRRSDRRLASIAQSVEDSVFIEVSDNSRQQPIPVPPPISETKQYQRSPPRRFKIPFEHISTGYNGLINKDLLGNPTFLRGSDDENTRVIGSQSYPRDEQGSSSRPTDEIGSSHLYNPRVSPRPEGVGSKIPLPQSKLFSRIQNESENANRVLPLQPTQETSSLTSEYRLQQLSPRSLQRTNVTKPQTQQIPNPPSSFSAVINARRNPESRPAQSASINLTSVQPKEPRSSPDIVHQQIPHKAIPSSSAAPAFSFKLSMIRERKHPSIPSSSTCVSDPVPEFIEKKSTTSNQSFEMMQSDATIDHNGSKESTSTLPLHDSTSSAAESTSDIEETMFVDEGVFDRLDQPQHQISSESEHNHPLPRDFSPELLVAPRPEGPYHTLAHHFTDENLSVNTQIPPTNNSHVFVLHKDRSPRAIDSPVQTIPQYATEDHELGSLSRGQTRILDVAHHDIPLPRPLARDLQAHPKPELSTQDIFYSKQTKSSAWRRIWAVSSILLGGIFGLSGLVRATLTVRNAYAYQVTLQNRMSVFESTLTESYESVSKIKQQYEMWSEYVRELADEDESKALRDLERIQREVEQWQIDMKQELLEFKTSLSGDIIDVALASLRAPLANNSTR